MFRASYIPDLGRQDPNCVPKRVRGFDMLMLPIPVFCALILGFLALRTFLSGGQGLLRLGVPVFPTGPGIP